MDFRGCHAILAGRSVVEGQASFPFLNRCDQESYWPTLYQLVIGECELAVAVIAILLWGLREGPPRIIILRTDSINFFQWFESAKSHGLVTSKLLRRILRWCIEHQVEVIPRYVRSAHNVSADGLTRWSQYACDQWCFNNKIQTVDMPELWAKWEHEWGQ